jgi:hypothetical protein
MPAHLESDPGEDEWPEFFVPSGEDEDELVEFYTCGQCWYLALALHRMSGWEILVVGQTLEAGQFASDGRFLEDGRDLQSLDVVHVVCRHPSGLLLDIEGAHTPAALAAGWGDGLTSVTEEQLVSLADMNFIPEVLENARDVGISYIRSKHPELFKPAPRMTP